MKCRVLYAVYLLGIFHATSQEEVRLIDLDPQDAQQIIEQQDTSLKYAPKIESNVPAVRYLGNTPHNVAEDIYLANQYHGQDGVGGYLYGYSVPDIAKTEKKKAGGDLRGAYNYIAGNGQEIKVEYWDDGTGFHQIDNVPKNLPEDLPVVKKAKEDFMRIWLEQAERNMHPVEDPYNSEGQYKEGPLSPQGQLQRQQQFAAQFGKTPDYQRTGGYQTAASQQSSIYQSNLEKAPHSQNSNYQPYQGRDQQNQGTYQSKQFSSSAKGPSFGDAPATGIYQGNIGQGFGKTAPGVASGQGQISQGAVGGGYGLGNVGAQSHGSTGYGTQGSFPGNQHSNAAISQGNTGYSSSVPGSASAFAHANAAAQSQGGLGYGGQNYAKGNSGAQSQGIPGYGGQPSGNLAYNPSHQNNAAGGYGHQNQWGQAAQKTAGPQVSQGGYQTQYQGQPSQNVNKYAPQPQASSYGGKSSQNYGKEAHEDDGQYHEENEEQQGPPKGFFYKFDYPVGIIVSKQGPAQGGAGGGYHHQQKQPDVY